MESVLVGNRMVTLEEFYKVSCLQAGVQLDTAASAGIKKSAGLAKSQKAPEAHNVEDNNDDAEEERSFVIATTKEQARATILFHLVWFMAGRSDVRPELVELLTQLLNEDIIPKLPRSSTYVSTLMEFLSKGDETSGKIQVFDGKTFSSANVQALGELTGFETFAFTRDQVMESAIVCLEAFVTQNLLDVSDLVAAFSCEVVQHSASCFDENEYVCRPHRGCVESAENLRTLLLNSRNLISDSGGGKKKKKMKKRSFDAIELTPQLHGPSRLLLPTISRTLRTELNGAPSFGSRAQYTSNSVKPLSQTLKVHLHDLYKASQDRLNILQQFQQRANQMQNIPLAPQVQKTMLTPTSVTTNEWIENLCQECKLGMDILLKREEEIIVKAKAKEEEAKRKKEEYEKKMAAKAAANTDNNNAQKPPEDDKAAAKRAAKAAKKAAKAAKKAAKNKNKSKQAGGLGLGSGTNWFLKLLKDEKAAGTDDGDFISTTIHPQKKGLITNSSLRITLERIGSGGAQRVPKIAKGARDFEPDQMAVRQEAFEIIRGVFRRHGAVEIDTPVFELKETLTGKYGEDSKLIYELADQGGELLALRYDLTVPFARFLALHSVGNIKRFHIGKVYRRDNPNIAKGRFREFYQCDYDVAGDYDSMIPETEVLSVAIEILRALPVGDFAIKLNHRVLLDAMLDICGVPEEKFRPICSAVDKLDKEPWSAVRCEMIEVKGLDPVVADRIGRYVNEDSEVRTMDNPLDLHAKLIATEWTGFNTHPRAKKAMDELKILFEYLDACGVLGNISFDLSLARGLDYYTGLIYEAVITEKGERVGSIAAGGRYDNLVGMFSGKKTPCVGVSIGIERVFAIMERKARALNTLGSKPVDVLVACTGGSFIKERMKVCSTLWKVGVSAEFVYKTDVPFRRQLQMALEKGIPYMVVLGEDEVARNVCQLKDVQANEQTEVTLDALPNLLLSKTNSSGGYVEDSNSNNAVNTLANNVEAMKINGDDSNKSKSDGLTIGDNGRFHRPTGL